MEEIASFIHEAFIISSNVANNITGKTLKEFMDALTQKSECIDLKKRVEEFSSKFPLPGKLFTQ